VTFRHAGKLTDDELAEQLQEHEQVLCIVNRKRQAQEVYGKLTGDGNIHLSTLMIPAHRAALIAKIRRRLKAKEPCRVVSTSLIEAGVDVDFPAVFRAEAGLDSILQAAGRCNREGRIQGGGTVTVFETETRAPKYISMNISAMREIVPPYPAIDSPETVHAYFKTLLDLKGDAVLDMHGVLDALERGIDGCMFPFRKIAERFHLIDNTTKTIYIPLDGGEDLVEQLRNGKISRGLFRKLGQFGVQVYSRHFDSLVNADDARIIGDGEDAAILVNLNLYSRETGLSLSAEEGKGHIL
jgi:CRISPR-associated endonuclease/helicase Cas3